MEEGKFMRIRYKRSCFRGFTLVELMATLAIAAIVLTAGVPSFATMIRNNQMTTNVNQFLTYLNYTRSEALKRGRSTTLCPSTDGNNCLGSWQGSLLIFVDNNNDGVHDATEERLKVADQVTNAITIKASLVTVRITFDASGIPNNKGFFTLCDSRGASYARAIIISSTGRAQVSNVNDTGGGLICP
jgi:type IV fimbrial biogenesis protein FimT